MAGACACVRASCRLETREGAVLLDNSPNARCTCGSNGHLLLINRKVHKSLRGAWDFRMAADSSQKVHIDRGFHAVFPDGVRRATSTGAKIRLGGGRGCKDKQVNIVSSIKENEILPRSIRQLAEATQRCFLRKLISVKIRSDRILYQYGLAAISWWDAVPAVAGFAGEIRFPGPRRRRGRRQ
jgi:hypothetical protein